jgi:hypothetical protein
VVGLERALEARRDRTLPPGQVIDVQFADATADPLGVVGAIYDRLGLDLDAATEDRMRRFLVEHPGDGGGAGRRYTFADTGLDAADLRERARPYQDFFGVPSEPVV